MENTLWHIILADVVAVGVILVPLFKHHTSLVRWRADTENSIESQQKEIYELKGEIAAGKKLGKESREAVYGRLGEIEKSLTRISTILELQFSKGE